MSNLPSIVCPIDFSEGSRTALNYAAVIADHFGARLLVMSVDDPLLVSAAQSAGLPPLGEETERELRRFIAQTVPDTSLRAATLDVQVAAGKPATQILRLAVERAADLIVMSSHGRSGVSKRFFGSTTERVLRETTIPVLVTPGHATPVASVTDISRLVKRVIAPVDLSPASAHQVKIAQGIASAMGVPLLVAYVLESIYIPPKLRTAVSGADQLRRADVEAQLRELADAAETIVLAGDASEEIVRLADTRGAGLIVMGLHSSGPLGPRMGTVTYRVLCLTHAFVLGLPP
ncbi:MAG: universal stress protein [Acidimicrobiia bacterium]|nr:universal stress protein [Acidimicrobiia bacterium]